MDLWGRSGPLPSCGPPGEGHRGHNPEFNLHKYAGKTGKHRRCSREKGALKAFFVVVVLYFFSSLSLSVLFSFDD